MGSEADYEHSYSPSKLSLLISRPSKPPEMPPQTPQTTVSVPFQWEEAPGKPRLCLCPSPSEPKSARTLELPPRLLLSETKVSNLPSPTTVLDGPYVGRAMSFTTSYRSPRVLGKEHWNGHFGSNRWSSFRKNNREDYEGSFDFSSFTADDRGCDGSSGTAKGKIARVGRRGSFFRLSESRTKSHLWASIYESFKQVVPWRRRQEKQRKCVPKLTTSDL